MSDAYEVVFTRSARRALEITLPESVAAAAFEFIVGTVFIAVGIVGGEVVVGESACRHGEPLVDCVAE